MADRAYMWCPHCDRQQVQNELFRGMPESHLFRCEMGHAFTYEQLSGMNPRKIPLTIQEKPLAGDVKAEFWVSPGVLSKFRERFPNQQNATVNAMLNELANGDVMIITGAIAKELKSLGVATDRDMIAVVKDHKRLTAENEDFASKINFFSRMMRGAGVEEEESVL